MLRPILVPLACACLACGPATRAGGAPETPAARELSARDAIAEPARAPAAPADPDTAQAAGPPVGTSATETTAAPGPVVLEPPPPSVASSIVTAAEGATVEGGQFVGWDGEHAYYAVGLPGISADRRLVAIVSNTGDGTNDSISLVSLATEGRSAGRTDPLSESHASEEETPAATARERRARADIARAARTLARGGFRSIARVPEVESEAPISGVATIEWSDDGWVTLRDPATGRVRFHERVVIPDPGPPEGLDDDALEEWENDHACDVPGLESASAWQIDADHVLLETRVNPPPDDCESSVAHRIVTLAP